MSDPNKTPSNNKDKAERRREKARMDAAKRNLNLSQYRSQDSGKGKSLAVLDQDTRSSSQFLQSKPSTSKKARLDLDLPNPMPAAVVQATDTTTTDTSATDTPAQPGGTPKKRKKTDASKKLKIMVLWRFFDRDTNARDNPHTILTHPDTICKVKIIDRFKVQLCGQKLSRSDGTTLAMRKHLRAKHSKTFMAIELEEMDHQKEEDEGRRELEAGMGKVEDFHANRISKF
jgi:hypothetical protein